MPGDLNLIGQLLDDLGNLLKQDPRGLRHGRTAEPEQGHFLLIKQLDAKAFGRGLDFEAVFQFLKLRTLLDLFADQPLSFGKLGGLAVGEEFFQLLRADGRVRILAAGRAFGILIAAETGLDVLAVVGVRVEDSVRSACGRATCGVLIIGGEEFDLRHRAP